MAYNFDLHRDTGSGNGGSGVVLGGEDVAAGPGDLGTEGNEGLDEDGSLDGCKGLERFQSKKKCQADILMCRQPAIRAPLRGWSGPYLRRMDMRPGISISASSISRRPKAARD